MKRMPWFKLWNESRNDPKLESLTDAQHRVWHRLLCFASEQEDRGVVKLCNKKLLAVQVSRGDVALLEETIAALTELDIITISTEAVAFTHWNARQYDKPSDMPEAVKERVDRHRERTSAETPTTNNAVKHDETNGNAPVTPVKRAVTPSNAQEEEGDPEGDPDPEGETKETDRANGHNPATDSGAIAPSVVALPDVKDLMLTAGLVPRDEATIRRILLRYYTRAPCPDVETEVTKMLEWLASKKNREHKSMTVRFFDNWLKKVENPNAEPKPKGASSGNPIQKSGGIFIPETPKGWVPKRRAVKVESSTGLV